MKRVILFIIDALSAPELLRELDNGRYPHWQALRQTAVLREQCLSIFPSITHAALTSLATGRYPAEHGVIGSHWYDPQKDKVAFFAGNLDMMLNKGLGDFFQEFLCDLNYEHLDTPTIFHALGEAGLRTAAINFPIFRGPVKHEVSTPLLLRWIPGLPDGETIDGPDVLFLGDLLSDPDQVNSTAERTGPFDWLGFADASTADVLRQMAGDDEFPEFTLAYFPVNDKVSHEEGPIAAQSQLDQIDALLGDLFAAYGGLDGFLAQFMLVITGDHSQSATVADLAEESISLDDLLHNFQVAEVGSAWEEGDELMPCPNLRAAQIYFKKPNQAMLRDAIDDLLEESRIDQIFLRAALLDEGRGYLALNQNGRLRFWRDRDGTPDRQRNAWSWEGDLQVVDGRVQGGVLVFPDYPNAFERLAGVLDSDKSGQLWLTACLGHEFIVPRSKVNEGGGSHASLHRLDSQPPLFVAGAPDGLTVPEFPRIIDIAPLCRAALEQAPGGTQGTG